MKKEYLIMALVAAGAIYLVHRVSFLRTTVLGAAS